MNPLTIRINLALLALEQTRQTGQLLIASTHNLFYLTGQNIRSGERMTCLLLTPNERPKLFIHEMFTTQLTLDQEIEVIAWQDSDDPVKLLASQIIESRALGVDPNWPSRFLLDLIQALPTTTFWKSDIIEKLREIKDEHEIDILRQSAKIADAVMHQVLQLQYFPTVEREMAETINSFFNAHQVYELSFNPIIGFGKNSANPHHEITNTGLLPDQAILIDMGGIYRNYCSDITRTVVYGKPSNRFQMIYEIVRDAQEEAIRLVKPGISFADIDHMIRKKFSHWGYDRYFTHRTGHGLGLELHEEPSLHANNRDLIKPGMVFTIEPGIYLPGEFGIRIEDAVVVTESGCEVLTSSTKEVLTIDIDGS